MFAVWEPILPTDAGAPVTGTLARLADGRVRQFYDPGHLVATRLAADAREPQPSPGCCRRDGILWDLLAIYRPGATWDERVPAAAVFDGPVVAVTNGLERVLQSARDAR